MKNKNDYKLNINLMGTMYNKASIMESSVSELFNVKPREEVIKGSPVYTFPTVLTTVGTTSRNGLVLSKAELDNMLAKELVSDRIANNAFWCEMDHPEEEPVKRFRQVMNVNQSHRINKFFYTPGGEHLAGEISTAPEGSGRILAAMIAMKSNVAFSMRAYAVMAMINGIQQKDINLVSYDSVYMPSNKASWGQTGTGADISEAFMQSSEFKDLTRSDKIMKFGVTEGQIMKFMESSWNNEVKKRNATANYLSIAESFFDNTMNLRDMKPMNAVDEKIKMIAESSGVAGFNPTHIMIAESTGKVILIEESASAEMIASASMMRDLMKELTRVHSK